MYGTLKKDQAKKPDHDQETRIDPRMDASRTASFDWDKTEKKPIDVGTVLNERFVLEEFIAAGGMGVVYKARDLRKVEAMDRHPYVAIKVLSEDFQQHPESWIALQREARKSQQLAHPNIITVYDFDRDGGTVFMTMELLEGEPLTAVLKRIQGTGMPFKKAWPLIEGMARALAYAHQRGIVYSDFKPGNVFITRENMVKVLDFGIARAIKRPGQQEDKTLFDPGSLGALTPAYASYEMITGGTPDSRDDIYALACVAYELLAGEHPYQRMTAAEAYLKHCKPKRIKRLNRKQWKGRRNGLALLREVRTPDIETFLAELQGRGQKNWKFLLTALLAAALLVPAGYYGYRYFNSQQLEQRIVALADLLRQGDLTPELAEQAAARLQALLLEAGRDPRVVQMADDLAMQYLQLANNAVQRQHWRQALNYLALAQQLKPGQSIVKILAARQSEILSRQAKQQSIDALQNSFASEFAQMQSNPGPAAVRKALAILDQLAKIAPGHPLLAEGRRRIAGNLADEVRRYAETRQWQQGMRRADEYLVLMPGNEEITQARKALDDGYQAQLAEEKKKAAEQAQQRRAEEIAKSKRRLQALLDNPRSSASWNSSVRKEIARLLPKNDPWLAKKRRTYKAITVKQQASKWQGAIKPKGAEKTD